jgi:ribose-phosphate pyrophosphokinase
MSIQNLVKSGKDLIISYASGGKNLAYSLANNERAQIILIDNEPVLYKNGEIKPQIDTDKLSWINSNTHNSCYKLLICQKFSNENLNSEIMEVLLTIDAFKRHFPGKLPEIALFLPYLPYTRQDRVSAAGEALSLEVLLSLFKNAGTRNIISCELHSLEAQNIAEKLGPAVHNYKILGVLLAKLLESLEIKNSRHRLCLVSPDKGRQNEVKELSEYYSLGSLYFTKNRGKNGLELDMASSKHEAMPEMNYIIVDDMIDGASTAAAVAEELRFINPKANIYALVAHALLSGEGAKKLASSEIKHIYASDSFNYNLPENNQTRKSLETKLKTYPLGEFIGL